MSYTPITPLPDAPSRTEPSTFSTKADALVAALATFVTETNAAGDYIDGIGTAVDADATAAAASATAAAASATAAAASADAVSWVSGTTYSEGDVVWSPLDYLTYRAKDNHTGQTIDPSLPTAWEIGEVSYVQGFNTAPSVGSSGASNLFFKSDGRKVYVTNAVGSEVIEYDLAVAWDIGTASFVQDLDVSAEELTPRGVFFKPDGAKMYVVGSNGDEVNEYDLSSAWDISSASHLQSFSVSAQDALPGGISFKSDGTKMYILGNTGDDVNEYDLSSAWDISTASYSQNFSVATQSTNVNGLFFKSDGTKMYVAGGTSIYQYDLSSAWDVSTASFVVSYDAANSFPEITYTLILGIGFSSDGDAFYTIGFNNAYILQFRVENSLWRNISGITTLATPQVAEDIVDLPALTGDNSTSSDLVFTVDVVTTPTAKKMTRAEFFKNTPAIDVNADSIRIRTSKTPASASATGTQGEIAWDADYLYVCVATNTWKRVAISTWP